MRALVFSIAGLLSACGGAAAQGAPAAAPGPPTAAPVAAEPAPEPGKAQAPPAAVPAPPAECGAFVSRAAAKAASCEQAAAAKKELDAALAETDARRDSLLTGLEQCQGLPIGLIRALRAELAPQACADAIVDPLLAAQPTGLRLDLRQTLEGLSLAGKLARLVETPPAVTRPIDKAGFQQYFRETLAPWIVAQASAIHQLAARGVRLGGYGKGIVAVEAGTADLRFVEVVREIPLPDDMARDEEVRNVYYAALDEALEQRKSRGRDAALVGLREFAAEGILRDARVDRARQLLSKLYAGRRIDALDGLLLPPLPGLDLGTVERRLAAKLPTFYASLVLADQKPDDQLLRALLERGLPRSLRAGLDAGKVSGPLGELYARALVDLGRRYWRSEDFERAARVLEKDPKAVGKPNDKAWLVRGLANALRGGPRDAAEMMLRGPFLPAGVGNVLELDALAKTAGPMSGMAAYDAAYILQLAPPRDADVVFWKDVAARFRRSAQLLADAGAKAAAAERAKAADDTARALR